MDHAPTMKTTCGCIFPYLQHLY